MLVSDLDLECTLWLKVRLAPLIPYIGNISLAFVAPPNMQVQLFPYNRVRLMRTPVLQVGCVPQHQTDFTTRYSSQNEGMELYSHISVFVQMKQDFFNFSN